MVKTIDNQVEYSHKYLRRVCKVVGTYACMLMLLNPTIHQADSIDNLTQQSATEVAALPQDVQVTIISPDDSSVDLERHKQEVVASFSDASTSIIKATDGELAINLTGVDNGHEQPLGIYEDEDRQIKESCFSTEQTSKLAKELRVRKGLADSAVVALYIADGRNCHEPGGAFVYRDDDNRAYMVFDDISPGFVVHEMGHVWGLPHNEKYHMYSPNTLSRLSIFELADLSHRYVYTSEVDRSDILLGNDDRITSTDPRVIEERRRQQEYSSDISVMGSLSRDDTGDIFTPDERQRLDPNRFRVVKWDGRPQEYLLSLQEGGISGVVVSVPDGSPLKGQIDNTIDSLYFGLKSWGDESGKSLFGYDSSLDLVITARGKDRTYTLGEGVIVLSRGESIEQDVINFNNFVKHINEYNDPINYVHRGDNMIVSISDTGVLRIDTIESSATGRQKNIRIWNERAE